MPAGEREGELIASIRISGGQLSLDLGIPFIDALGVDGLKSGSIVGAGEMDGELLLITAAMAIFDLEVDEELLLLPLVEMVVSGVCWIKGPGTIGIDGKAIGE